MVDGTCHDGARGERATFVVLLHELLTVLRAQHRPVAPDGLGDEEGGPLARMIQGRGVELHELHVLDHPPGAVHHGDAVAGGYLGGGRGGIHAADASRGQQGHFGQEGVDVVRLLVEHVGPVTLDTGRVVRHDLPQVVLRQYLDGEEVLVHIDFGMLAHLPDEALLYLVARVVLVVQDAELRMPAFLVQVEVALFVAIEVHAPFQQLLDLRRSFVHHLFHRRQVAVPVTGNERVLDMFLEIVRVIGHRGDATLGKRSVRHVERVFTKNGHLAIRSRFQRKTDTGDTTADYQKIISVFHCLCC